MVLEGLGVPYESFLRHQEAAVQNVHSSSESLPKCAKMLESFGLGTAFRVPSLLLNLEKLCNVKNLDANVFYRQMLELATHHVLRELKNRARIPIPGAYTLVGVADVHKYLGPGEIFVCIRPNDSNEVTYLEGDVVISRSPTIHPGDVQVVRAIGRPKAGSPFAKEPLANTVVFSVRGMFNKFFFLDSFAQVYACQERDRCPPCLVEVISTATSTISSRSTPIPNFDRHAPWRLPRMRQRRERP